MKLELYYYDQCPFCQRVLRTIDQLGLKDRILLKNTLTSSENAQFHQRTTGRSTVPCLYIDDNPLFESSDIMKWLDSNNKKIKG